jgi:hypothetical protein
VRDNHGDAEQTEIRWQAGAVVESAVITPISGDYFTNYPEAPVKHQARSWQYPQDLLIDSIAADADVGYRCVANLPSFKRAVIAGVV